MYPREFHTFPCTSRVFPNIVFSPLDQGNNVDNPQDTSPSYPLYPIYVSAEENDANSDKDTRCYEVIFDMVATRPRRRINRRN